MNSEWAGIGILILCIVAAIALHDYGQRQDLAQCQRMCAPHQVVECVVPHKVTCEEAKQ